jgi:hypothetical protein
VRLLLFLLSLLLSSTASAQDFIGARALSMGEAYRATASGNDALYFNPAGLPSLKRYALEGQYLLSLSDENHQGDVSVVDSKTNALAVGVAYTFLGSELTRRTTIGHTATFGIAYPVFDQLLMVGAGLKYKNVSDAIAGNFLNAVTADVGVLSRIPGGLSLAAVGYNLVPIKTVQSSYVPVSAAFAAALDLGPLSAIIFGGSPHFGVVQTAAGIPQTSNGDLSGPLDNLSLSFDWLINFQTLQGTKSRVSAGLEWLLGDLVPVRAGYLYDELTNDHRVSAGLGVVIPSFGLDVAYQQSVVEGNLDRRSVSFALKGFLPL